MKQNMEALERANEVRLPRAALKREIRAKNATAPEVLRQPIPGWLENMKIEDLLLAIPYLHRKRCAEILLHIGYRGNAMEDKPLSPLMPVGNLTKRQRLLMADLIEKWETKRGKVAA